MPTIQSDAISDSCTLYGTDNRSSRSTASGNTVAHTITTAENVVYSTRLHWTMFLSVGSLFVVCIGLLFTGVGGDNLADCVHFNERNSGGAVYPAHDGSVFTRV